MQSKSGMIAVSSCRSSWERTGGLSQVAARSRNEGSRNEVIYFGIENGLNYGTYSILHSIFLSLKFFHSFPCKIQIVEKTSFEWSQCLKSSSRRPWIDI
jgi:hypothetical protein